VIGIVVSTGLVYLWRDDLPSMFRLLFEDVLLCDLALLHLYNGRLWYLHNLYTYTWLRLSAQHLMALCPSQRCPKIVHEPQKFISFPVSMAAH
jgi:hypothetical protein